MQWLDALKARIGLKAKAVVGLDIGPDAIVVASLSKGKTGYVVEALGSAPMPSNSLQDGEIADPAWPWFRQRSMGVLGA